MIIQGSKVYKIVYDLLYDSLLWVTTHSVLGNRIYTSIILITLLFSESENRGSRKVLSNELKIFQSRIIIRKTGGNSVSSPTMKLREASVNYLQQSRAGETTFLSKIPFQMNAIEKSTNDYSDHVQEG